MNNGMASNPSFPSLTNAISNSSLNNLSQNGSLNNLSNLANNAPNINGNNNNNNSNNIDGNSNNNNHVPNTFSFEAIQDVLNGVSNLGAIKQSTSQASLAALMELNNHKSTMNNGLNAMKSKVPGTLSASSSASSLAALAVWIYISIEDYKLSIVYEYNIEMLFHIY